jgi:hypothetical protein
VSFYIKIDNSDHHKPASSVPVCGSPVEGLAKICLVTAFTSVVGDPMAAYPPDQKDADQDLGWVSVSLAGHEPVALPFSAGEFEELILDASHKNRIADFTGEHWPARLEDIHAIRNAAHPIIR